MTDTARVIELIKTIAADEALRNRLTAASDAERVEIITSMGYGDINPAEVAGNAARFIPEVAGDIDDAELANVAGGTDTTTTLNTPTVTASASAAVAT